MSAKSLLGFTTERLPPTEDHTLPERFSLGLVSPLVTGFTRTLNNIADKPGGSPYCGGMLEFATFSSLS